MPQYLNMILETSFNGLYFILLGMTFLLGDKSQDKETHLPGKQYQQRLEPILAVVVERRGYM